MPRNIDLGPIAAADLSGQTRPAWQNKLIHDLLQSLIQSQNDKYTPLPSRYSKAAIPQRDFVEQRLLEKLTRNQKLTHQMAQAERKAASSPKLSAPVGRQIKPAPIMHTDDIGRLATNQLRGQYRKLQEYLGQPKSSNDDLARLNDYSLRKNIESLQGEAKALQPAIQAYLNPVSNFENVGRLSEKVGRLNPTQAKLEATKMKKLAGFPVSGNIDSEFDTMTSIGVKQALGKYEKKFRENFAPQVDKYITPPAPMTDSEGEDDPLVQQAVQDDYSLSKDAIKSAMQQGGDRRDRFLDKVEVGGDDTLPRARQIADFLSERSRGAGKAIIDQMTENYLTNILPRGNIGFMAGAWNSPQRKSHQENLFRNMAKDVENQLLKMEAAHANQGLQEAGQQQARSMKAGETGSLALNQGLEAQTNAARGVADIERVASAEEAGNLEALGKIGQEKRQAEENILLEAQKEALKQRERPVENNLQALAAVQGVPAQNTSDMVIQQQQPNYGATAGYGLGNMAAAMMMPQMGWQGKKAGGLVQKFADGGMPVSDDQYRQMLEQEAQNLMGTEVQDVNPMAVALGKMGDSMAERYTGMPGLAAPMIEAYQGRAKEQAARRQQGMNLMQKMHASRVKQQEFLQQMEFKNRQLAAQQSQHAASLGETARHHQAMEGFKERELMPMEGAPQFEHKEQAKQHYKTEQDLKNKLLDSERAANEMANSLGAMSKYSKNMGYTGPGGNLMANELGTLFSDKEALPNRRVFEQLTTHELFDVLGRQKGVQSDKDMAEMRKTLPSLRDKPEAIKAWIDKGKLMVERSKQANQFIEDQVGQGKSYQDAEREWLKYANEHPLFDEEKTEAREPANSNMSADEIMNSGMSLDEKKAALRKIANG